MSSFFRGLWKSNSKHKKLCEEWALANSCESVVSPSTWSGSSVGAASSSASSSSSANASANASSSASASSSRTGPDADSAPETIFSLKYLGSTLVESPSSELETAEAIKTIISVAKASGKKLQRVSLAISLRGIRMMDLVTEEELLRVSIYRISYCSADARHDHVFAFIATDLNETIECHAYLCPKRKVAQTVTLTVAQAFNTAYELWQLSQLDSQIYHAHDKSPRPGCSSTSTCASISGLDDKSQACTALADKKSTKGEEQNTKVGADALQKNVLIDISGKQEPRVTAKVESWVSFEEEGIPLRELKSPSSPMSSGGSINSTATFTHGSCSASSSTNLVAPQQPKLQNAWLLAESSCSTESDSAPTATSTRKTTSAAAAAGMTASAHEPLELVCSS